MSKLFFKKPGAGSIYTDGCSASHDLINEMPPEIIVQIIGWCDWEDIIRNVRFVNQNWFEFSTDFDVWRDKHVFKVGEESSLGDLELVSKIAEVHELHFERKVKSDEIVRILANCPRLKKLQLTHGCEWNHDIKGALKATCRDLTELTLCDLTSSWLTQENLLPFAEFNYLSALRLCFNDTIKEFNNYLTFSLLKKSKKLEAIILQTTAAE